MCCSLPSAYSPSSSEPEQRLLRRRGLVPPVAGDDHVGGALVLDLQHRAGVGLVRRPERLGHDAVEPGALEPAGTTARPRPGRWSSGSGGSGVRRPPAPPRAGPGAPRTARPSATRRRAPAGRTRRTRPASSPPASAPGESAGWIRSWSFSNSSRSPMATKISPSSDAPLGQGRLHRLDDLGEVAGQRLGVAAGQLDLVAVAEHEAPEAVPLGLEDQPAVLGRVGDALHGLGEHRLDRRHHREIHPLHRRVHPMPIHLTERDPRVPADRLVAELVPPPRFADVSFDSYRPDPGQPSQAQAVEVLREFAGDAGRAAAQAALRAGARAARGARRGLPRRRLRRRQDAPARVAVAHRARPQAVRDLRRADPPGRGARLPRRGRGAVVLRAGVRRRVRARRPGRHGAGLHAAHPAARGRRPAGRHLEHAAGQARRGPLRHRRLPARDPGAVGALRVGAHRRRGLPAPRPARGAGRAGPRRGQAGPPSRTARASTTSSTSSRHLAQVHPSKYGALLDGVRVVCLEDVRTVDDQAVALRLVVLADRMYDRDLPVVASGVHVRRAVRAAAARGRLPQEVLPGGQPPRGAGPRGRATSAEPCTGTLPHGEVEPHRDADRPARARRPGGVRPARQARLRRDKKEGKAALYALGDELSDLQERLFAEGRSGGAPPDPAGPPGHGHLRQGRHPAARGRAGRPAGRAHQVVQGADRGRAAPRLPVARRAGAARRRA